MSRQSTVGIYICLSGAIRTFHEPCAGPRQVTHVMKPLDADVHASIAVDQHDPHRSNVRNMLDLTLVGKIVRRTLRGVRLRNLEIYPALNGSAQLAKMRYHSGAERSCSRRDLHGYAQAVGWQRCAEWMLPLEYTWIIRLRTDTMPHFRIVSLPTAAHVDRLYGTRGTAIVPFVSICECGNIDRSAGKYVQIQGRSRFRLSNPPKMPTPCSSKSLCGSGSDTFAMLAGAHAQSAYLRGYADDFCRWDPHACSVCNSNRLIPEDRVGYALASRGVPMRDLRFVSQYGYGVFVRPRGQSAAGAIVCSRKEFAQVEEHTWNMTASSVLAIPSGSWSESRRLQACLPPPARPAGWERLCLDGPQYHPSVYIQ